MDEPVLDPAPSGATTRRGADAAPRGVPRWLRMTERLSLALVVPSGVACLLLMVNVIADVAGRSFWNHPLGGTLERTSYWWMVTIVFLALAYTQLKGEHIRATAVTEMLSPTVQRWAEAAAVVLLGVLALLLAYYGWEMASHSVEIRETATSDPPIAIWPFSVLVPVGCLAFTAQCVCSVYRLIADQPGKAGLGEVI